MRILVLMGQLTGTGMREWVAAGAGWRRWMVWGGAHTLGGRVRARMLSLTLIKEVGLTHKQHALI